MLSALFFCLQVIETLSQSCFAVSCSFEVLKQFFEVLSPLTHSQWSYNLYMTLVFFYFSVSNAVLPDKKPDGTFV